MNRMMMGGLGEGETPNLPGGPATAGELPVPLSALAQPDDAEQMQTPAAGDSVTLQVEAQVVRIEGETAYVRPTTINGNPLEADAEPTPEALDAEEGSELRAMALNG